MDLVKCYNSHCNMRGITQKGKILQDTIECEECGNRIFYQKSDEEILSEVKFEHIVFIFALLIMLALIYESNY